MQEAPQLPGWHGVPLVEIMSERLGVPVEQELAADVEAVLLPDPDDLGRLGGGRVLPLRQRRRQRLLRALDRHLGPEWWHAAAEPSTWAPLEQVSDEELGAALATARRLLHAKRPSTRHLSCSKRLTKSRRPPSRAFIVAAGLEDALEYARNFGFKKLSDLVKARGELFEVDESGEDVTRAEASGTPAA